MTSFEVNDMTCGHCASTIGKAVAGVDKDARVQIDLGARRVVVEASAASVQQLSDAIKDAGYSPVVIDGTPAMPAPAKRSGGCCCG